MRRGEGAGADRLGRDVGQRGQLRGGGGRADSGIALQDRRPMGKRARPGESARARRTFEESTAMIARPPDATAADRAANIRDEKLHLRERKRQLFDQLSETLPPFHRGFHRGRQD